MEGEYTVLNADPATQVRAGRWALRETLRA